MSLNDASMRLILRFEVGGGEDYYNRFLQSPTWPGESSGVTIGVGYDLGYNSSSAIEADWSDKLDDQVIQRLLGCAGKTGLQARNALNLVKDIVISWVAAFKVYQELTVPKFEAKTRSMYPGFDALRPNCQGALVSLVFNRGESLKDVDRRKEMRAIGGLVTNKDYNGIAAQIRSMKRLWIGTTIETGMNRRRDAEADLVMTP